MAFSTTDFGAGGKESFQGTIYRGSDSGSMTRPAPDEATSSLGAPSLDAGVRRFLNRGFRNAIDFPNLPSLLPSTSSRDKRRVRRDSARGHRSGRKASGSHGFLDCNLYGGDFRSAARDWLDDLEIV
jgi:hypothetical protein